MLKARSYLFGPAVLATLALTRAASAQEAPPDPTGAPPPDAKAEVAAPKDPTATPPKIEKLDGTNVSLSAGGLLSTGNSRLLAGSVNGNFDKRWGDNGIGASILGNYGQGAPPGSAVHVTSLNAQGRLRYDRYFSDRLAGFLINTGRHDRFQGLAFRYNLDPGVKYLFLPDSDKLLWGELGYDFQHDIRRDEDRTVVDADSKPVLGPNGQVQLLDKTRTDHSLRAFAGHKYAFNKDVNLSLGIEYLQSLVETTRYRVNGDVLFASQVGGGLSIGVGFSARFDHDPIPGKAKLDTSTTLSLIYGFSDAAKTAKKEVVPCPEPPPPPPPVAPATAPPPPPAPPPADAAPTTGT